MIFPKKYFHLINTLALRSVESISIFYTKDVLLLKVSYILRIYE